ASHAGPPDVDGPPRRKMPAGPPFRGLTLTQSSPPRRHDRPPQRAGRSGAASLRPALVSRIGTMRADINYRHGTCQHVPESWGAAAPTRPPIPGPAAGRFSLDYPGAPARSTRDRATRFVTP